MPNMAISETANMAIPQASSGSFAKQFSKWDRSPVSSSKPPSSSKPAHPPRDMFRDVPEEILLMILQFMRPNEIIAMVQVNKRFHRVGVPEMWRATKDKTDNFVGWTWLHRAARDGDHDMVKRLVAMGYNTRAAAREKETPVYLAGFEGHRKIARSLMKVQRHGEMRLSRDPCNLHAAAFLGDRRLVKHILDVNNTALTYSRGWETYWQGMHLLHAAAWGGHPRVVQICLSAGSLPDVQAVHGITPLHVAAFRGHKEVFTVLLRNGARVNKMDKSGRSAWSLAMGAGHTEAAELLLKLGAPKCGRYKGIPSVLFARFRTGKGELVR